MKSLVEFIKESIVVESEDKTITFDFTGIENAEETLKSLGEYSDVVTVEDNKVTVTLNADNIEKVGSVQDIIQQAVQHERAGEKSTNDEQYAQKVGALEKKVAEMNDAIDAIENPDDGDDKDGKKEDGKSEGKKEGENE